MYSTKFLKSFVRNKSALQYQSCRSYFIGTWKRIFGKEHSKERNLESYLARKRQKDESIHYLIDIGFPFSSNITKEERLRRKEFLKEKSSDKSLTKLARACQLFAPLDDVYDDWMSTNGPLFVKRIAEHYGVFEHLFGDAFFHPVTPMRISFEIVGEYSPVYFGNVIKPKDAQKEPLVDIGKESNVYHTLILSNLDGHMSKDNGEYVHWMVANIPKNDVQKGEVVCSYLPPFPPKGTGYHRYVFVLYQHDEKIDFSDFRRGPPTEPDSRDFNTYEFYRDRQDFITPSGLLFFQTDWDYCVTNTFHKLFNMPEPRYEYDFPRQHVLPPEHFPLKKPFNTYLDRYRDPKQISKEVLVKKLKTHHPFEKPEPPLRFPHLHTKFDTVGKASWIQVEEKKRRLGWGRTYNDNKDIIDP